MTENCGSSCLLDWHAIHGSARDPCAPCLVRNGPIFPQLQPSHEKIGWHPAYVRRHVVFAPGTRLCFSDPTKSTEQEGMLGPSSPTHGHRQVHATLVRGGDCPHIILHEMKSVLSTYKARKILNLSRWRRATEIPMTTGVRVQSQSHTVLGLS